MFREDSYLRDPFSNVTADVHKYVAGSVRIEIRGCARFAGAAPPSGPPTDARTHARTNRWKDRCAANESKSKERVSRMIWLASGGKTVGNFARGRRGESCSIVITFYIAILPSGSLNSFRRPDRYEARKIGIGGRGVSHLSRDPLWRGATTRTATGGSGRINGSHDSRECEYIYIYSFRFPSLFHSRFRFFAFSVRKERSCRIEPISFAFLTFSKFILPSFRFLFRPFSSRCENVKY